MITRRLAFVIALLAIVTVPVFAEKPVRKPQEVFAPYWTSLDL